MKKKLDWLKDKAKKLKTEITVLYLAYKDPRVPLRAKILTAVVVGYALSPIDLIPDFIPVLGYLDDLVLLPLGISLIMKMIPEDVLDEYRKKVSENPPKPNLAAAAAIIAVWAALAFFLFKWLWKLFGL